MLWQISSFLTIIGFVGGYRRSDLPKSPKINSLIVRYNFEH